MRLFFELLSSGSQTDFFPANKLLSTTALHQRRSREISLIKTFMFIKGMQCKTISWSFNNYNYISFLPKKHKNVCSRTRNISLVPFSQAISYISRTPCRSLWSLGHLNSNDILNKQSSLINLFLVVISENLRRRN